VTFYCAAEKPNKEFKVKLKGVGK
jgi:hypothetical protein